MTAPKPSHTMLRLWPGYSVTTDGAVFSHNRWQGQSFRQLRTFSTKDGYLNVHMNSPRGGRRRCPVHKLVAEAFLPPRPSPEHELRHLDGNPHNNALANLAWGTRQENADDRERHGRTSRGAGHAQHIRDGVARKRLIAAAPDLLAACERTVAAMDSDMSRDTSHIPTSIVLAWEGMRYAIARARGETP